MKKPKIGIVLDREREGDYSEYPYYVLREHYFNAVHKAGGIPIGIDLTATAIPDYVDLLDGLLMPGGDYDIPPSFYGDSTVHDTVVTKVERLEYDLAIAQAFLEADKPILGICVGQQLLAVMNKGTLIQDIKSQAPEASNHYNSDREAISHDIVIEQNTLLHSIVMEERVGVNSHHHQAVKTVGNGMIICAVSSDGVVEAVEVPSKRFCLGVQWHPEFLNEDHDVKIFDAFIQAC